MPLMPPLSPEFIEQLAALVAPRRYTAAEARELIEAARVQYIEPGRTVLLPGMNAPNAALLAAAPDLAATVCELEAERDALRTRLALHEAFVSALDAHEEALHALECATSATFAALYDARASAWERAHAAREALREAAK